MCQQLAREALEHGGHYVLQRLEVTVDKYLGDPMGPLLKSPRLQQKFDSLVPVQPLTIIGRSLHSPLDRKVRLSLKVHICDASVFLSTFFSFSYT